MRHLFRDFARVKTDVQNFDGYGFGIKREWFLDNLAESVEKRCRQALRARPMPRFSVVVPTGVLPDLLEFCLGSLAEQTYDDFEVIVSDNPVQLQARDVFDRFCGDGWRYLRPEEPVAMHDNFERGCDAASGDFVALLIDKTVLHPSALSFAARVLEQEPDVDL